MKKLKYKVNGDEIHVETPTERITIFASFYPLNSLEKPINETLIDLARSGRLDLYDEQAPCSQGYHGNRFVYILR